MKKILIYGGLGVLIVAAGLYTWMRVSGVSSGQDEGFHLKCTLAECGSVFTVPRDQVRSYPRDPDGKGFRCPKCGKFSGQVASQCERCGEWFAGAEAVGREGGCPKCRGAESGK